MGQGYILVNKSKGEIISFAHLPASKAKELTGNPVTAAMTTWYLLSNIGDMQALESYHRIAFGAGESIMSIDKYNDLQKKLFKVIESNLDEETSENFKNKFIYLNDTTQRKRLKHLIDENKERLQKLFKVNRNFIDELVDARNNMTHIDNNEDKKDKLNRLELTRLINKSTTILELCLFNELGVSDNIKDSFISGLKHTRLF